MTVAVLGAGAFGTALAVALARGGRSVVLWTRSPEDAELIQRGRRNEKRLPGIDLPNGIRVVSKLADIGHAEFVLVAVPMQQMSGLMHEAYDLLDGRSLVACAKGIDLSSEKGSVAILADACPMSPVAVLTGPSFASDIARGLPTALTLACADEEAGLRLQNTLSTPVLRLYRTTDTLGAELGGALKNVIAIAAGVVIGAGLGDSARAALMTRGFAEMNRLALSLGAQPETLSGLSGFGDLVLTCTSKQSRNFRYGLALGSGTDFDYSTTVEGSATAKAVTKLAEKHSIDMPIAGMVAALVNQEISIPDAVSALLSRPLRKE